MAQGSVPRVYLINVHGDGKRQCFEKRVYNKNIVEAKDFDGSLLTKGGQWTTLGIISIVRQALCCIRGHISSVDIKETLTGCQLKQLAKLLDEPALSTLLKVLKEEAILLYIRKEIHSHVRIQLPSPLMYTDIRLFNYVRIH